MDIRTGFGYDVHKLEKGRELWLGGIKIDSSFGAVGHSDADVLVHAICDALLGAANLGDIGQHFPDTDPAYKDIDSKKLLGEVVRKVSEAGFRISNIDSTVCLEEPKLSPHIDAMRNGIGDVTGIETDRISIKATTSEKMGFVGRREGIAAYATVLVMKSD